MQKSCTSCKYGDIDIEIKRNLVKGMTVYCQIKDITFKEEQSDCPYWEWWQQWTEDYITT